MPDVTCTRCEADLVEEMCPACDGPLVELEVVAARDRMPFTMNELRRRRHRLVCRLEYIMARIAEEPWRHRDGEHSFKRAEASAIETALVLYDMALAGIALDGDAGEVELVLGRGEQALARLFEDAKALLPKSPEQTFRTALAALLKFDNPEATTREAVLAAVQQRLARIDDITQKWQVVAAARDQLAKGEHAWKSFARRRTHQLEVLVELLHGGDIDSARRYLRHALSEEAPHG